MPGQRSRVERLSAPVLLWLSARPRALLPLAVVGLLIGGLAAPGAWAVPLLALLVLLLAWLSYLSWPALSPGARVLRSAVLAMVAVTLVQRAVAALGA